MGFRSKETKIVFTVTNRFIFKYQFLIHYASRVGSVIRSMKSGYEYLIKLMLIILKGVSRSMLNI